MEELTVKDLWARTMSFDQSQWTVAVDPGGAQGLEGWLTETPSAWLNDMRRPPIERTHGQCVFVVVGEAGSGKSTLLEILRERELANGNLPILIDFKNSPSIVGKDEPQQILQALYAFMKARLQLVLAGHGKTLELKSARMRQALELAGTDEFIEILINNPGIKELPDEKLLAYTEIYDATQEYEKTVPDSYLTLLAAQSLTSSPRTTFLIDNIEGLPERARRYLFELLTASHAGRTILVVAIRSEHQHDAQVLYQGRPRDPYHLAQERGALLDIAEIRNNGAKDYGLSHLPQIEREINEKHSAFIKSLELIKSSDYISSLFTGWLNGNIRDFLTLVAEMSGTLPDLKGRSLRGFVSSYLVESRAHSSLQKMFDPHRIWTAKHKEYPFVYLPLRILVYLECRAGSVARSDMVSDFQDAFGISETDIDAALKSLEKEEAGKPNPCRSDSQDSSGRVHLLSCGETFIRQVVFECDYLATLFDRIEDPPEMPEKMDYSETKLRKSLAVIEKLILPGFTDEHPYVKRGTPIKQRTRIRLRQYERMFSWRQGHWFVGLLKIRIHDYAKNRSLLAIAEPTLAKLQEMEDCLNHVARGGRRS